MRPTGTRVWRKTSRKGRRGIPTGRRATHVVEMAYGQQQRIRANAAAAARFHKARRAAESLAVTS